MDVSGYGLEGVPAIIGGPPTVSRAAIHTI